MTERKSDPPKTEPSTELATVEAQAITIVPPEGNGQKPPAPVLNVNLVINQLAEKEKPELLPERLKTTLAIIREHEAAEVEIRRQHVQVTIDAKTRDPDRISKRADAASRRVLRYAVAMCPLLFCGLVVFLVCFGSPGTIIAAVIGVITLAIALAAGLGAGGDAPSPEEIASLVTSVMRNDSPPVDVPKDKVQPRKPKQRGRK